MSCISVNLNLGLTLGSLLGGIVYDRVGWYGLFGVGLGILLIDVFLRIVMIEKSVARQWEDQSKQKEDETLGVEKSSDNESSQKSKKLQKLPDIIALLRFPRLLAALWLLFIQAVVISAFDTVLPLRLNQLFGWTSFQAGLHHPLGR